MSSIKERRLFSLSNFRGLDTENKPIKVAPYRATDGENFIIDSDTLKTRPALVHDEILPFALESDEKIVAWHDYGTIRIYITSIHFYVVDGNNVYNETYTSSPTIFHTTVIGGTLDFENKTPLFREEKEALFIFGLGDIYVFSKLSSDTNEIFYYVLYALNNKPENPFDSLSDFFDMFEALPKPYEPTIWLDEQAFEDVNLLSNVSKYRLFASSTYTNEDKTKYELPTHYDETKHKRYDVEVTFYKDNYANYDRFAVFLGVADEHITSTAISSSTYGAVLTDEFTVSDTYFPASDFIYDNTTPTENVLQRIVGITKEEFFAMKTEGGLNSTFEEAMVYIKTHESEFADANLVLKFNMPIRYRKIVKDATTDNVVSTSLVDETIDVYVQLRKYVDGVVTEDNYARRANVVYNDTEMTTYPVMPTTYDDETFVYTGTIDSLTPVNYGTESFYDVFHTLFSAHVRENIGDIANGGLVKISAKMYKDVDVYVASPTLNTISNDDFSYDIDEIVDDGSDATDVSNYGDFYYTNPSGYDIIKDITEPHLIYSGDYLYFWQTTNGMNAIRNIIFGLIEDGTLVEATTEKTVILETYLYSAYDDGYGNFYSKKVAMAITITYTSGYITEGQNRLSIVGIANIYKEQTPIATHSYSINYNESHKTFDFLLANYFYDYRNTPSIDIKITFTNNPDYQIIANSTFGTSFGVENRLFLAGNPDYPHIDRYNVSNDLLGDGVDNQSYELSYFPSKNYRVVGGKGAINGYVVATDSQLYITKAKYPNDDTMFVRQRNINEDGQVYFTETRTSAKLSPINSRCLARFNNDIVVLTARGLYALELSSNVLTDERLIKLRSAFVNTQLIADIADANADDIFIIENNEKMYICVGDTVYHADIRYISTNENSPSENVSYELVKWVFPDELVYGQIIENEPYFLDDARNTIYKLEFGAYDEQAILIPNLINAALITGTYNSFFINATYDYIADNPEDYVFYIKTANKVIGYKAVGEDLKDFTFTSATRVTINNSLAFRNLTDGDTVKIMNGAAWETWTISGFEASGRLYFDHETTTADLETGVDAIYKDYSMVPLYVTMVIKDMDTPQDVSYRLSPYKPSSVITVDYLDYNDNELYSTALENALSADDNNDYRTQDSTQDLLLVKVTPISLRWVSAITDFGNNLMEKTSFKMMLHATKLDAENTMQFGYRTLRRLATLFGENTDLSNVFNFENVNLSSFGLATFNSVGMSFPMKENNFLYMQFTVLATGQIELNSIEIIYKNNRGLKTVS